MKLVATRADLVRVSGILLLASVHLICPLWAQGDDDPLASAAASTDTSAEDRLQQIREEMTSTLSRLEVLQRELTSREQVLDQSRVALATAAESGDSAKIGAAQRALSVAEEAVMSVRADIATEKQLYDRLAERCRIAQEQANLAAGESSTQDNSALALIETIQRRDQVNQAEQRALLATRIRSINGSTRGANSTASND